MRARAFWWGALSLAVVLPILVLAQQWPTESPPRALPARRVEFPTYQLKALANGLQVLFVPYHEQPSVAFRLLVRAGAMQEPTAKPGVAGFVAGLLTQGTTTKSAKQIADLIDSAGGLIGAGSSNELTSVNGAVLKDRTETALELAADIVQHPAFSAEEMTLRRNQSLSSMQVGYDDPEYVAGAVFDRLVFGSHPFGRPGDGTPQSLAQLTRADLVDFHRTWFVPGNALLAIVGDMTADEAFAAAQKAFGSWEKRDVPLIKIAAPPEPSKRVVVIDRPGSAQTEIRVGHLAIPRTHPDFIAFDLAVRILGGEGANRLFGVLRSDRGLTYGASADLHAYRTTGVVVAETDTRSAATAQTLRLMVDEFARLQREPVHPAELMGAQDFIAGHFPLSIESPSAIAEQVLARLFYGQDLSEISTYVDKVQDVEPRDIQRVARELLKPAELSIVLVGDASVFADQLKAQGFTEVERIPLGQLDLDSPTLTKAAPGSSAAPRPAAGGR